MLTARQAERRLLLLSATRWWPVGLVFGLTTLLPLQRGLSLAEVGVLVSVQGFVVLVLELPTGGLADVLGRRPVLVVAAATGLASTVLFVLSTHLWQFVVAMALQGVFRALDSGPLEAWYVDTALAEDPATPVERGLSRAGSIVGAGIAVGALASAGLVAWHPFRNSSALLLPFAVSILGILTHLVLTGVLVREPHRHGGGLGALARCTAQTPPQIRAGLRLVAHNRVLRCLVLVEVFWAVGMIGFETFMPVRLAELSGGIERAAVIVGPVAAVAWGRYSVGATLAGLTAHRFSVGWTAVAARLLNGALVVVMGLVAGPAGFVAAYLGAYLTHGANNPVHATLLHRQAAEHNRTTVLSVNSMVSGGCYSLGLLALGPLAQHTSTGVAVIVAGAFSVLGALLYAPAVQAEHAALPATPAAVTSKVAG